CHPAGGARVPCAAPSSAGSAARTRLIAVAHVEVDRYEPPVVSDAQALAFAATLAALREIRPGEFLQIDFEATSSQRAFFLKAVAALRQRLPDAVLSATAFPGACTNGGRKRWPWTRWSRCCSAWAPSADVSGSISPAGEIFARPTAVPASASRPTSCRLQYRPADAFMPSAHDAGTPKHTPRCARGYANGQMLLGSIDARRRALGACAPRVGDRAARAGN